jgi:hypothetical protein
MSVTVDGAGAFTPRRASTAEILRPPQAGCSARKPRTCASIVAAVTPGDPRGRRDRSSRPASPSVRYRAKSRYPSVGLTPNQRQSSRRLTPSASASPTNSRLRSIADTPVNGISDLPSRSEKCHGCPRTPVTDVSGLNTPLKGEGSRYVFFASFALSAAGHGSSGASARLLSATGSSGIWRTIAGRKAGSSMARACRRTMCRGPRCRPWARPRPDRLRPGVRKGGGARAVNSALTLVSETVRFPSRDE